MTITIENYLVPLLAQIEPQLSTAIRSQATTAGWPAALAAALNVKVTDKAITVQYPEALTQQIEDLEYGTFTDTPKPVIRKFIEANSDMLSETLANWTVSYLINKNVIP